MSDDKIESALEQLNYGVSVVTVGRGGVENGLTVSWLCQVSFTPPMVMIAVDSKHYSIEFLESTKNFTVNVLREGQGAIAGHFAKPSMTDRDKLDDLATREAPSGAAILSDALAYLDCDVISSVVAGDHTLFIGQVLDAGVLNAGAPMTTSSGMRYRKAKSSS